MSFVGHGTIGPPRACPLDGRAAAVAGNHKSVRDGWEGIVKSADRCRMFFVVGSVASLLMLSAPAVLAAGSCGDGVVDANEECDGGPGGLFVDGDPASAVCASGSRCYFRNTCCKFNCQYVGTPGAPCQDGNTCTGPDTCNQVGVCNGGPNAANNTPCDDGLFCTGVEGCQNGVCLSSTGNPCSGAACNACNEATDSCFTPIGSPCSDGSACIAGGTCDGAGGCTGGVPASGPCDDGLFCNGTDSCGEGACSVHSGSPCAGADGDGNCVESCDESTDLCNANDPNGSSCEDGVFCNGGSDACTDGVCSGAGTPSCDDLNSCTTDACDEGLDSCTNVSIADGSVCDDGDRCTIHDLCEAGGCNGQSTLLEDLCPWTLVLRENPRADLIQTNFQVSLDGDVCGGSIQLRGQTIVWSDLVSAKDIGDGAIRLAPDASVVDDIVSAGAGATAFPASDYLPCTDPAVRGLAAGTLTPKCDASGFYDLSGGHGLASDCLAARTAYPSSTDALDALSATDSIPSVRVRLGETATIVVSNPGGLNVIDVDGSVKVGKGSTVEIDGGGNPNTVVVLRIGGKLQMLLGSELALGGGLIPRNTLVYVKGRICLLGDLVLGGGTVLCSPARVKTGRSVAWAGAIFGDGRLLRIGEKSQLQYTPFQGF